MIASTSIYDYLREDIRTTHVDLILLIMGFASAMVDTMTVPTVKTFVANNTGNWILLSLGTVGLQHEYPGLIFPVRCIVALAGSWTGSFLTGQIGHRIGMRKRWWLLAEFIFESLLVYMSAILLYTHAVRLSQNTNLVILFFLSWVFGSQGVATKALGVPGIAMPAVVTGAMNDLLGDPDLFVPVMKNKIRNQRASFVLVFFCGGITGGLVLKYVDAPLVLVLTASMKLLGAVCFLFVPGVVVKSDSAMASPSKSDEEKVVGE